MLIGFFLPDHGDRAGNESLYQDVCGIRIAGIDEKPPAGCIRERLAKARSDPPGHRREPMSAILSFPADIRRDDDRAARATDPVKLTHRLTGVVQQVDDIGRDHLVEGGIREIEALDIGEQKSDVGVSAALRPGPVDHFFSRSRSRPAPSKISINNSVVTCLIRVR